MMGRSLYEKFLDQQKFLNSYLNRNDLYSKEIQNKEKRETLLSCERGVSLLCLDDELGTTSSQLKTQNKTENKKAYCDYRTIIENSIKEKPNAVLSSKSSKNSNTDRSMSLSDLNKNDLRRVHNDIKWEVETRPSVESEVYRRSKNEPGTIDVEPFKKGNENKDNSSTELTKTDLYHKNDQLIDKLDSLVEESASSSPSENYMKEIKTLLGKINNLILSEDVNRFFKKFETNSKNSCSIDLRADKSSTNVVRCKQDSLTRLRNRVETQKTLPEIELLPNLQADRDIEDHEPSNSRSLLSIKSRHLSGSDSGVDRYRPRYHSASRWEATESSSKRYRREMKILAGKPKRKKSTGEDSEREDSERNKHYHGKEREKKESKDSIKSKESKERQEIKESKENKDTKRGKTNSVDSEDEKNKELKTDSEKNFVQTEKYGFSSDELLQNHSSLLVKNMEIKVYNRNEDMTLMDDSEERSDEQEETEIKEDDLNRKSSFKSGKSSRDEYENEDSKYKYAREDTYSNDNNEEEKYKKTKHKSRKEIIGQKKYRIYSKIHVMIICSIVTFLMFLILSNLNAITKDEVGLRFEGHKNSNISCSGEDCEELQAENETSRTNISVDELQNKEQKLEVEKDALSEDNIEKTDRQEKVVLENLGETQKENFEKQNNKFEIETVQYFSLPGWFGSIGRYFGCCLSEYEDETSSVPGLTEEPKSHRLARTRIDDTPQKRGRGKTVEDSLESITSRADFVDQKLDIQSDKSRTDKYEDSIDEDEFRDSVSEYVRKSSKTIEHSQSIENYGNEDKENLDDIIKDIIKYQEELNKYDGCDQNHAEIKQIKLETNSMIENYLRYFDDNDNVESRKQLKDLIQQLIEYNDELHKCAINEQSESSLEKTIPNNDNDFRKLRDDQVLKEFEPKREDRKVSNDRDNGKGNQNEVRKRKYSGLSDPKIKDDISYELEKQSNKFTRETEQDFFLSGWFRSIARHFLCCLSECKDKTALVPGLTENHKHQRLAESRSRIESDTEVIGSLKDLTQHGAQRKVSSESVNIRHRTFEMDNLQQRKVNPVVPRVVHTNKGFEKYDFRKRKDVQGRRRRRYDDRHDKVLKQSLDFVKSNKFESLNNRFSKDFQKTEVGADIERLKEIIDHLNVFVETYEGGAEKEQKSKPKKVSTYDGFIQKIRNKKSNAIQKILNCGNIVNSQIEGLLRYLAEPLWG